MSLSVLLTSGAALASEGESPRAAVWLHPVPALVFTVAQPWHPLVVPLGFNAPLNREVHVMGELMTATRMPQGGSTCQMSALEVRTAFGLHMPMASGSPLRGFFLQPKLLARLAVPESDSGCRDAGPSSGAQEFEVGQGLDVGYQWTFGRVYLASMLGAHVGYCFNCQTPFEQVLFALLGAARGRRVDGVRVGLNVNLLRLGMSF